MHVNDLPIILGSSSPPVLSLLVDGGPDYSPRSLLNLMQFGEFFERRNLDALLVTTNAPHHLAHNPIEHAWAPLTSWLAVVTLPILLPGGQPPCSQPGLKQEQVKSKETLVFDAAID